MKLIHKKTGKERYSSTFNIHSLSEILVNDTDGGDSDYIENYNVVLSDGRIKDLNQAFKDHDVITDNNNTIFFEPLTEADKKLGFTLD